MVRKSAAISRRFAIASFVYRPCLKAFLLPFGWITLPRMPDRCRSSSLVVNRLS